MSLFQILNISQAAMLSQLQDLDVTSNNLANLNTTGFKASRTNFQELLTNAQLDGIQTRSTQLLLSQGGIRPTQNPLDVAIQGEGFFQVSLADGRTAYTRDGQFHLDAGNQIVTSSGDRLVWQGQVPQGARAVRIDPDGTVSAQVNESWQAVGTIALARFPNPTALQSFGSSLWLETPVSGAAQTAAPGAAGFGSLRPQSVESSNVNVANEMTHLITLQRSFQLSTRAFQQTDQMIGQALAMRRG